jgi:hypothetical protein
VYLSPFADSGMLIFWVVLGIPVTSVAFIMSVFFEAMIMWSQGWDSLGHSFIDSFLMNLVSLIAAIIVGSTVFSEPLDYFISGDPSISIRNLVIVFIGAWFVSVVLEGGTLYLIRQRSAVKTWITAMSANIGGYVFIVVLFIILSLFLGKDFY